MNHWQYNRPAIPPTCPYGYASTALGYACLAHEPSTSLFREWLKDENGTLLVWIYKGEGIEKEVMKIDDFSPLDRKKIWQVAIDY